MPRFEVSMNSKKRTVLDIAAVCFDINASEEINAKVEFNLIMIFSEQNLKITLTQGDQRMFEFIGLDYKYSQRQLNSVYDALIDVKSGKVVDELLTLPF